MAQPRVVAAGHEEQHDLHRAHEPVGEREQQRLVAERIGDAQRDHEQGRHRREDREPDRPLVGVHDAAQPRVADPAPPQHAEHGQALGEPGPRRLVGHQRRALGQRQHEHEVEEQLERRDAVAVAEHRGQVRAAGAGRGRHGPHPFRSPPRALNGGACAPGSPSGTCAAERPLLASRRSRGGQPLALELVHRRQAARAPARPPRSPRPRRSPARRRGGSRAKRQRAAAAATSANASSTPAADAIRGSRSPGVSISSAPPSSANSSRWLVACRPRASLLAHGRACAGAPRRAGGSPACSCRRRTCRRAPPCGAARAGRAAR